MTLETPYSQRDMEWAEDGLGHQAQPTMDQAGCLVTAMASAITDLTEHSVSPGYLNGWLRDNNGFYDGNLFVFASVKPFGLRLQEIIRCETQPAPIDRLQEWLDAGAALVILVDALPGAKMETHWVRLVAVDRKDGQIIDPWQAPGKEHTRLSSYFARDWDTPRAIFMVAVYGPATIAGPAKRGLGRGLEASSIQHQPAICLRPNA